MKTCATCRFFLPSDDASGICRRYPPALFLLPDQSTVSLFPPMLNEGRCGEHKENDDA